MSISSEIDRIGSNVTSAFSAVSQMGGTVPSGANSDNLAASIRSIPQSGGGFAPTVISCALNDGDATQEDSSITWSVQLTTGSYTSAVSAAEAGTPAILKITMQETETDETTGESTTITVCTMDVLLQESYTSDSVIGTTLIDGSSLLVVELSSTDLLNVAVHHANASSAPSDYEINISCTAPELLSGSYTTSLASGTYANAMSAAQNGGGVMVTLNISNGAMFGKVPMYLVQPPQDDGEGGYTTGYGYGSTTIRAPLNGSESVFNVAVKIDSNDTATITTTNMSTSSGGLPPVTTADAGKFLQVDNTGAWAAVAIPNASGVSF